MTGRWPRPLVYLLVFALVPILTVFGNPDSARAATYVAYGTTATARPSFVATFDGPTDLRSADCTVSGNLRLSDQNVHTVRALIRCKWGPNFEFDNAVSLRAYGPGAGCELRNMYQPVTEGQDADTILAPVTLQTAGGTLPASCTITSLAFNMFEDGYCHTGAGYTDHDAGTDKDLCDVGEEVFPWALGLAPAKPASVDYNGTCPYATVSGSPILAENGFFKATASQAGSSTTQAIDKDSWYRYAEVRRIGIKWRQDAPSNRNQATMTVTPVWEYGRNGTAETGGQFTVSDLGLNTAALKSVRTGYNEGTVGNYSYPTDPTARFSRVGGGTPDYNWKKPYDETFRIVGISMTVSYPYQANGQEGQNDPANCRFYFGKKFLPDDPNSTKDDPTGPLGTDSAPPVEESPITNPTPVDKSDGQCSGFKFTDPSSWAGAGICMLVKLIGAVIGILERVAGVLGSILSAIGNIAGAILDGLVGALRAVFVPSGAHFTSKVEGVKDSWRDTAPGQVTQTYTRVQNRLTAPSDTGCAGPTVRMTLPLLDREMSFNPLAACSPVLARVAQFTRTALLVGIYVAALFLCFRIIASAIGLKIDIGGGDD